MFPAISAAACLSGEYKEVANTGVDGFAMVPIVVGGRDFKDVPTTATYMRSLLLQGSRNSNCLLLSMQLGMGGPTGGYMAWLLDGYVEDRNL